MADIPTLTEEERRRGMHVDAEAGEKLRGDVLTRAQFRAFLAGMTGSWRGALCGDRPPAKGEWARAHPAAGIHAAIGFVRRSEGAAKAKGKARAAK